MEHLTRVKTLPNLLLRLVTIAFLDTSFLKVAILCGELDLVSSLAPRLIHSYLLSSDWRGCHDVLKDCSEVKVRL